jgi:hypothetical protein
VQKVRVLVANRPRLMRDVVLATLAGQPDIEIVGETQNDDEITEFVERVRPDFVIIALDEPESHPGICRFLLGRYPQMRVLAIAPDKNISVCYWAFVDLRSKRFATSEKSLLGTLRSKTLLPAPLITSDEKRKCIN